MGLENWNSDDSFLYSENVAELFSSPPVFCLNSIYSIITFGKLIKTLVWPGPGLLVSVNRDAGGDMMIENAPGYLDAGYQSNREEGYRGVSHSLSSLTIDSAHIRGTRSFSRNSRNSHHFSHITREPGPRLGCPAVFSCLVTRAPWSHNTMMSPRVLTSPEKYCSTATRGL